MKIIKFSDKLYRVYNDGNVKDVWVDNGEIVFPENPHNILTAREQIAIEMELF